VGTTPNGIVYPDPTGIPQREALQDMAESIDPSLFAAGNSGMGVLAANWSVTTATAGNPSGFIAGFTSPGPSAVFIVAYSLSCVCQSATNIVTTAVVDSVGTISGSQSRALMPAGATDGSCCISSMARVTGLAAGSQIARPQARLSAAANPGWTINASESTITVWRVA